MKLTFEITKSKMGETEVYHLKVLETGDENILRSNTGIGQFIMDRFEPPGTKQEEKTKRGDV